MLELDARPVRAPRLVAVEIDGETVLYDPDDEGLHLLDQIATVVWSALDGEATVRVLCEELADSFGVAPETVQQDVVALTRDLMNKRLVSVEVAGTDVASPDVASMEAGT
jgi:hypothetical protein